MIVTLSRSLVYISLGVEASPIVHAAHAMQRLQLTRPHEWHRVGDIVVTATIGGVIDDELWDSFLRFIDADGVRVLFCLTSNDVAGITAIQRKKAAEVMSRRAFSAVVLTDSRVIRGVLTAMSWLGAQFQPFRWNQIDEAARQVIDSPALHAQLVEMATQFHKEMVEKR